MALDTEDDAPHKRRINAPRHFKYCFTDFGISTLFDKSDAVRLVLGEFCRDKTVPEINIFVPYDPFKVDIYILGNVYKGLCKVSRVPPSATPPTHTKPQCLEALREHGILT